MAQNAAFGTTVTARKYMANVLGLLRRDPFFSKYVNRDFGTVGDDNPKTTRSIKKLNQKFVITSLHSNGWSTFNGSDLSYSDVREIVSELSIDQPLKLAEKIPSMSQFKSSVEDPESAVMTSAAGKLLATMDKEFLKMYADAGAGNWIGTNYATGTVTVAVTTGVVTGSGTTFTSAMVGKPFKAAGHTKWYRVKTFNSATEIVIENDSDDLASAYDGGAITAGSTYVIQAATAIALTKSNIAEYLSKVAAAFDESHGDHDELAVPQEGRFITLPAIALGALRAASEFNRDIEVVYNDTVSRGKIGRAYGLELRVLPTSYFQGDNTNGYYCIAGHKDWLSAGYGFVEPVTIIDNKYNASNFGSLIKGLFAYGFKVADDRRMYGGVLLATF